MSKEEITATEDQQLWMSQQSARFCAESASVYEFVPAENHNNRLYVYLLKDGVMVDEYLLNDSGEVYEEDPLLNYKIKMAFRQLDVSDPNASLDTAAIADTPLTAFE